LHDILCWAGAVKCGCSLKGTYIAIEEETCSRQEGGSKDSLEASQEGREKEFKAQLKAEKQQAITFI
jgi:hypothetical protein